MAQDIGFSVQRQGFDSPRGYYAHSQDVARFRGISRNVATRKGLRRFLLRLAKTRGRLLHRVLHRLCIGFCTAFNGPLEVVTPEHYTELFFLDKATALAVGHRPCWTCRRACFRHFKAAWLGGNPQAGLGRTPTMKQIDSILHADRLTPEGKKRVYQAVVGDLPDGAMVCSAGTQDAFLLWRDRLHHWTPGGYDRVRPAERDQVVDVLTPRSIVSAIMAGYEPELNPSVR